MKAEIHDEVERLNYQTVVNENPDCHFSERKKRFFSRDERTILERISFLIHTLHDFYLYRIRLPITRRKKRFCRFFIRFRAHHRFARYARARVRRSHVAR